MSACAASPVAEDDADSAFRGAMRALREDVADIHYSGLVQISGRTMDEVRERAQEWIRVAREGGLEIDRDWDEARVAMTVNGLSIGVSASRPNG